MTVRLIDIPASELWPMVRALSDAGCDAQLAQMIRRKGGGKRAMDALRAEFMGKQDVAGLFSATTDQLTQIKKWNKEHNWGFTEKHFTALGTPPELPEDAGNLVTVVLVPYLGNKSKVPGFYHTFKELWKLAAEQQENSWRWYGYKDASSIRLLEGIKHPKKCLRWEIIDLGANWDKKNGIAPKNVRNPQTSPHAGILACAALHPNWVRVMDGNQVPYVWVPGYQVAVPGDGPWRNVPDLDFNAHGHEVRLYYGWDAYQSYSWGVPAFFRE